MGRLDDYFAAWNEAAPDRRRDLLERSVTAEVELVHPVWGRSSGIEALIEHIEVSFATRGTSSIVGGSA